MKTYAIGIDIGGTNTVMGLVSRDGKIVAERKIKTQAFPIFDDYIQAMASELRLLMAGHEDEVTGVGIGAPNGNYYTGTIEFAPNLPWKGQAVPLASGLMDALDGMPVVVTNDANAAAMGEMAYGAAKGMKHFIMLTLGTGLGSGIVVDGRLVYGHDGFAGELGHAIVDWSEHARQCGCGRRGCLEAYCSATGMARTARILLGESIEPSLLRDKQDITSLDIYEAARQGDKVALQVFEESGRLLGRTIANFVTFSAPEAVILFGGPTAAGDILLDPIRRHMEANMNILWKGKVKLCISQLDGSAAAVLGASALVL